MSVRLNILPITAGVLINRGVTAPEDCERFLNPSLQHLHDPFLMADMKKAVCRIIKALKNGEKIAIYGDYDTDGAASTALLLKFFGLLGVACDYYIPHRIKEGYGLHKEAIKFLAGRKANPIITVDNGINAFEAIEYANSLGIDVIITDHHEPQDRLPNAHAVINPKRSDCRFPFKELAGVGVAFNLIMALRQALRDDGYFKERPEPRLREMLDIAAIGTIADVVPLIDENRIFVKFGIGELKKSSNKGLLALRIISGLDPHQLNAITIAFRLAPRINAAGRIDDQTLGTRLLITNDSEEAAVIAQRLHSANSRRQSIEGAILKEADEIIKNDSGFTKKLGAITLAKDKWHPGVIGIVAARIAEEHKKPTVIIGINEGKGRGSVRSVGNYNIIEVLKQCKDLLINFGGHKHAAGFSIAPENIEEFSRRFDEIISSTLKEGDRIDIVMVDCEIESDEISEELIEELEKLEPFGEKNPEPTFCLRELKVSDARIVAEKHLKLKFTDNMVILDAIGFGMAHHSVNVKDVLDVAFIPQRDTWRGEGMLQLKLRDLLVR